MGIVRDDTLDTLISDLGPQSGYDEEMLLRLVSLGDSLFVLGNHGEFDGVPTTSYLMIYTDTGVINPYDYGMTGGILDIQKDPISNTIILESPFGVNDSNNTFITYIRLYENGEYKRYDTIIPSIFGSDPIPYFSSAVLFNNEVIAYNVNQDYDGGKGLYYLNRDSLKWKLEKSFAGDDVNMVVWNEELYVTNSDNKIWKKDAAGWSLFHKDTIPGDYYEGLYVFNDEMYVAMGTTNQFGNKFIENILVYRSGAWISLIDTVTSFSGFQGFSNDGSHLYVYGKDLAVHGCSINYHTRASLLRLAIPVAVKELELDKNTIDIYPNPASTTLTLTKDGQSTANVIFYNLAGVQVNAIKLTGTEEIDISSWPAGVYFYRMDNEAGKVVIAR